MSTPPAASPGRPRDPRVEGAVRAAVLALLVEGGYEAVSFKEVALRAGVGQPTVYRRWGTKAELVEFAIFAVSEWSPPEPTGDLEADLARLADVVLEELLTPPVHAALPGLILAHYDAPDEHTRLRAWAEEPVLAAFTGAVEAAGLGGEVSPDDVRAAFEHFLAALTFTAMTRDRPTARLMARNAARITDRALQGLVS
ncbi:TetR/AcrR family transcriptional regulator [Pimelobacter simplex]|uniref:TetR/AcrR family transcriptional regulator n=1 Tax=Nocardioides simplex TaxID=2045 RepID=UPI001931E831|nr:TetR/AcrR family transcriptional regulator [Pimelobacter simplex]